MSENVEIYTAGKNFTLPLALTAWTNSTSAKRYIPSVSELCPQITLLCMFCARALSTNWATYKNSHLTGKQLKRVLASLKT